jgi:Flp pilus assembly protein TadD
MNSGHEASGRVPRWLSYARAALSLAALGLSLPGCASSSKPAPTITSDTRMSIADIAAAGGDNESARAILAAAAQTDPNNGDLQLHYAAALLQADRVDDALGVARQAVERHPRDAALAARAAQLELRAGDPTLAAATFQSAIGHGVGGTSALNGLGVARVQLGDLPGAEDAFRRAIGVAPGDYAARNNLALALVLQGRAGDAVPMLQSLANEPGVPGRVKHNLALAYAEQGDTQRASAALSGVVASSAVSREIAAFATLRTETPTLLASNLGPAELLEGRTSGPAYAGAIPPQTVPAQAIAAAAPAEAKPALLRPAPVTAVQAASIAPPGAATAPAAPAKMTVASAAPADAGPVPPSAAAAGHPPPNVIVPALATEVTPAAPAAASPGAALASANPAAPPAAGGPTTPIAIIEPADDGQIKVRIAAVPTRSAALVLWQNLAGMVPDLLNGRSPLVKFTRENGRMAWRLGTGGFRDVAAAEQFCRQLRERGPNCTIGL